MAAPVSETIAALVKTRLAAVTTTNGYEVTVDGVTRPVKLDESKTAKHLHVIVTQGDAVRFPALDCPGNPPAIAWSIPFIVAGITRPSEEHTDPIDKWRNVFWADMVKGLTNATAWHNWNQNAIDTLFGDVVPFEEDGTAGVQFPVIVTYRHDENDPYTAR